MKQNPDSRYRRWPLLLGLCLLSLSALAWGDNLTELLTGKTAEKVAGAERVIEAGTSIQDDQQIRRRLQGIFSEIESLQNLTIDVNGGIVSLRGEVATAATEDKAVRFARQVEGVVEVENSLTINRDLQPRLQATWRKAVKFGQQLLSGLPLFFIALLVWALFWITGRWVAARERFFLRISPNYFIAKLLSQLTQLLFFTLGLVVALVLLDATPLLGTILGAAGIIGLAVGFAVRDTVENYIASILLSVRNPFEVNDLVDIGGHDGNVVKLTSRATILLSPDGNHIRIPNATVFKAVIINFTRHPERRFSFEVGVDTDQDLVEVQTLAFTTLTAVPGIMGQPGPMVVVQSLGDSNVVLSCYGWVDQRNYSFLKVRSEAIRLVKSAFDQAGIVMPEPVYKVRLFEGESDSGSAERNTHAAGAERHGAEDERTATGDVSVDHTIEKKVAREQHAPGEANLLSAEAPREL